MTFKEKLLRFLERYSPDQLLNTIQELLQNLIENIRSSGSITLQFFLTPILLIAIGFLYPVVLLRKLLTNLIVLLKNLYKLLRKLFLIAIQEINAYWARTRREGRGLLDYLVAATQKMLAYIQYLLNIILNGNALYETDVTASNRELLQQIPVRLIKWFSIGILSTLMSLFLISTFMFGVPVIHRQFTGDFPEPRPQEDDLDLMRLYFHEDAT